VVVQPTSKRAHALFLDSTRLAPDAGSDAAVRPLLSHYVDHYPESEEARSLFERIDSVPEV
jgi:hypothetical protein